MSPVSPIVLALGLFMMPVSVAAQTTGDPTRSSTGSSSETTVSVKSLLDAKVLDSANREMGTIRSLLADPQTGKLVRVDIDAKGSGSLGKSDQQISVPWEQVSVKRQDGNFVLVLKQEALEKVQSIQKQDSSGRQNQQPQQRTR